MVGRVETVVIEPDQVAPASVSAPAEVTSKKERVLQWFNEQPNRMYLSGSDCQMQLKKIGVDTTVKHINTIKKELKEPVM